MGVLNLTPDSFSDGGKYNDPDRAFARAMELEEQGADIVDIGAESTRPGSAAHLGGRGDAASDSGAETAEGPARHSHFGGHLQSEVAERAIELGAEIINDPSGLTFEPQLARVVSNHDAGLVINHMRGRPETWAKLGPMPDPMGTIARDLDAAVSRARTRGHRQVAPGDRPRLRLRQTQGAELADPGSPRRARRARSADPGRALAQDISWRTRPPRKPASPLPPRWPPASGRRAHRARPRRAARCARRPMWRTRFSAQEM